MARTDYMKDRDGGFVTRRIVEDDGTEKYYHWNVDEGWVADSQLAWDAFHENDEDARDATESEAMAEIQKMGGSFLDKVLKSK